MDLKKTLKHKSVARAESKPIIFDLSKPKYFNDLNKLLKQNKILNVIDCFKEQLKEYYEIINPKEVYAPGFEQNFETYFKNQTKKKPLLKQGKWVHFPWNGSLVHILDEKEFFIVRTGRNRNLITESEQKKFYDSKVGIAGLSVGNSVALAIVLQGGAKHIKLADFDLLALSNTNRVKAGVENLGLKKVELTARQIYEINPYAQIEIFDEGLNEKNIKKFFKGLNIVIDEIDNLAVKYLIRVQAKKNKLPVIMAADNGDSGVVDIERYDKNPKLEFFHGRMGKISYDELKKLTKFGIGRLIVKHIGTQNIGIRTYKSFLEMGKSLVSWPQLGGSALLNGSAVAYCVKRILNDQNIIENRSIIDFDKIFVLNSKTNKKAPASFKKILGL